MRFSIIIPVYNAEKTLQLSLDSLRSQTFRDFEAVFIDDGSSDGSPAILEEFCQESGVNARVVRQSKNGGVAAARNRGLREAKGEYLAFLDADDTISPDALEKISASANGADIIGWNWQLGFEKNAREMRQAQYDTPLQALKNLMGGTMRWNLWLFALRRDFVLENGLAFIDGANMGEDMQFMIGAFARAGRIVRLEDALYRYNAVSATSISRQFTPERRREIEQNLQAAEKAVAASDCAQELAPYVDYLKLFLKLPLLIGTDEELYRLWSGWFPEANQAALANKALPLRTRVLQWMAGKRQWWAVKLYYRFVYQFVYGIIYR